MKTRIDTLLIGAFLTLYLLPAINALSNENWKAQAIKEANMKRRAARGNEFVVAELFTSENCSHCPPAYSVAKELIEKAEEKNARLYVLDFHVDYWNDKGWVDPFSDAAYSARQKVYSKKLKTEGLYTPQMIMNGKEEMVGSEAAIVYNTADALLGDKAFYTLDITGAKAGKGENIKVSYSLSALPENAVINYALIEKSVKSQVLKGANMGKELVHYNVVRLFDSEKATEKEATHQMPAFALQKPEQYQVIVYLQDEKSMEILAADGLNLE